MAAPSEPTISVVNDGNGDSVTVTVAGDAAVTNKLYHRTVAAASWTAGLTRVGDGDIVQTGLADITWHHLLVIAESGGGEDSLPSNVVGVYVTSDTPSDTDNALWSQAIYLRQSLAKSAAFQAWVGATGTEEERIAESKTHVYIPEIPCATGDSLDDYMTTIAAARPFVVLSMGEAHERTRNEIPTGAVEALFEAAVAGADAGDPEAALRTFSVALGNIIAEVEALTGQAGYLWIDGTEITEPPWRPDARDMETEGDFTQARISFTYG